MRKRLRLLLVVGGVLFPAVALAQSMMGTLIGTVKDEQGGLVAGASVRLSSPDLIGGPVVLTTNETGSLRFPALMPGWYVLEVTKPGFQSTREPAILITVGATIERTLILKVPGHEESVVVQPGSRVDVRGSGIVVRYTSDYLYAIPTRRFSMIDWLRFTPGFSPTSPSSGSVNSVSGFGSGTNGHLTLFDGLSFTCPCSGEIRAEIGVDFMSELQIVAGGASAEYGNMQGAVINAITKHGSNRFLYDAAYYTQPDRLTSQPVRLEIKDSGGRTSGYERAGYRDATATAGGPIFLDRLWFFAGYQYLRDYDSQPGVDPQGPRTYEQNKLFVKLNWQIAPGWQWMSSYHQEWWVNPEAPTLTKPFEATLRRHASVPAITFGHLTNTRSPNTVWEVRFGHFVSDRTDDPSSGDVTRASRQEISTGVWSGAPASIGGVLLMRTSAKVTTDHYRRLLSANHHWRFGVQLERGEHRAPTIIPTGTRHIDKQGQEFKTISSDPSILGGVFHTASAFVTDALTLGDRLTINAGLRFDHNRAISQDLPALDSAGNETGAVIAGAGTLYTWNVWSPRLGVTMKLSASGRTMLRGTFGRFYAGVLTGELGQFHPAAAIETTTEFDAATGVTNTTTFDPQDNLKLDPAIRAPHTDEFSIGVDREFERGLTVTAAYVHKDGRQVIGWTDACDCYRDGVAKLSDGRILPVFELDKPAADPDPRLFLLTNPPGYSLTYNGLVLAAEKRHSNGWQVSGSYTYSRASGLLPSSGAEAAEPQVTTVARVPIITFGRDPNDLTNARGLLPNDRPHMLRVMGSLVVPRTGWVVAASAQHFSGKPWSASEQVRLPQGQRRILIEPRGTRRLSSQTLVDLRVSRSFSLGSAGRVDLLIDVLNALNETAEEALASDDVVNKNFGKPTVFVDPRRVMLGVRLNLGR